MMGRLCGCVVFLAGLLAGATDTRAQAPQPAAVPQVRVLIVSGAAGSEEYTERQRTWREALVAQLTTRMAVPSSRIVVLTEALTSGYQTSTAVNVRQAIAAIRASQTAADTLLVVLFGHGTFDGVDAKFNLVGPDHFVFRARAAAIGANSHSLGVDRSHSLALVLGDARTVAGLPEKCLQTHQIAPARDAREESVPVPLVEHYVEGLRGLARLSCEAEPLLRQPRHQMQPLVVASAQGEGLRRGKRERIRDQRVDQPGESLERQRLDRMT